MYNLIHMQSPERGWFTDAHSLNHAFTQPIRNYKPFLLICAWLPSSTLHTAAAPVWCPATPSARRTAVKLEVSSSSYSSMSAITVALQCASVPGGAEMIFMLKMTPAPPKINCAGRPALARLESRGRGEIAQMSRGPCPGCPTRLLLLCVCGSWRDHV